MERWSRSGNLSMLKRDMEVYKRYVSIVLQPLNLVSGHILLTLKPFFFLCFFYSPCPEQGMGDEFNLMDHSDLYILDFSK